MLKQSYRNIAQNTGCRLQEDEEYMRLALSLAAKGIGKTSPNPLVGAVIVKNKKIVGVGFHRKAGLPHAEVDAIGAAGRNTKDATLYVTLEPCNTYGRTPPCAPAIVDSGIKRIVIAAKDPNPVNYNKGIQYLRKNDLQVCVGILRDDAIKMNEAYNKYIKTGMPFVTVKVAMSMDGKIATYTGNSKWISSKKSRLFVRDLRKEVDAVLVGRNTFIKDRPRFRGVKNKIFLDEKKVDLKKLMKKLGKMGIMHVLIEGGGETIASALKQHIVDRLYVFIAPKIIGGRNAPTPVEGEGLKRVANAIKVKDVEIKKIGDDILLIANI